MWYKVWLWWITTQLSWESTITLCFWQVRAHVCMCICVPRRTVPCPAQTLPLCCPCTASLASRTDAHRGAKSTKRGLWGKQCSHMALVVFCFVGCGASGQFTHTFRGLNPQSEEQYTVVWLVKDKEQKKRPQFFFLGTETMQPNNSRCMLSERTR